MHTTKQIYRDVVPYAHTKGEKMRSMLFLHEKKKKNARIPPPCLHIHCCGCGTLVDFSPLIRLDTRLDQYTGQPTGIFNIY